MEGILATFSPRAEMRIEILATLSLNQLSGEFNGVMLNVTSMNMN